MTAVLKITDGTTTVDLLGTSGYILSAWRPAVAGYKGGGTFQTSSLSDGRRLVHKTFDNVIERFDLKAVRTSQDTLIETTQELRRLLEKASDYWTTKWQKEPVWIEAKATAETNTRYAIIHAGAIPDDENPFAQPFLHPCSAIMDNLTLLVERGHWLGARPGMGTCVEISGIQKSGQEYSNQTFAPSASTDDAYVWLGSSTIFTATSELNMGAEFGHGGNGIGIRFRNVTIPIGSRILSAYISMVAQTSVSADTVSVKIFGEDDGVPAAFSTFADFQTRTRTGASVVWNGVPAQVEGSTYSSPDVTDIIQEIVDRGDWASGNNLAMFIEDNGSSEFNGAYRSIAAFDHASYTEPRLIIDYQYPSDDYGMEETCTDEVYISNKRNKMQLTNIHYWDSTLLSWSANLIDDALPHDLLPAAPVAGDLVLFGIDSAVVGSNIGVFSSLVFDLIAHTGITGTEWRYSDTVSASADPMAPWATLPVQDNTDAGGAMSGTAMDTSGTGSVHWNQPTDWTTRNPQVGANPALGVTAYWVAMVVTGAAAATSPQQQSRRVYTITRPDVSIAADQVPGDINALARIMMCNRGDSVAGPSLKVDKYLVALRSDSRGINFTPFINIDNIVASAQNPDNFTIVLGGKTTMAADTGAPIGRSATYTATLTPDPLSAQVTIQIANPMASEYIGRFHAYARIDQTVGVVGDIGMQLRVSQGATEIYVSDTQYPTSVNAWQALDFGSFDIFSSLFDDDDTIYGALSFALYIEADATGDAVKVYDFVVMPTDEMFLVVVNPMDDGNGSVEFDGAILQPYRIDIDSVTFPKRDRALNRTQGAVAATTPGIVTPYRLILSDHLALQSNADQRVFSMQLYRVGSGDWRGLPSISHSVQIERISRYLGMRGSR